MDTLTAKRNDAFRKAVLIRPQRNGRCNLTHSVAALERETLQSVKAAIQPVFSVQYQQRSTR